ncbi:MAG: hypothetical protein DRQ65_06930 [Gammaproteobacteria bacterium]|nr:MAG: hypothetical protein DRQ65_06930 [Gammaproteobacteria bacterium]
MIKLIAKFDDREAWGGDGGGVKSCARWQGETCDYGMAIEGLLRRDGSLHSREDLRPDAAGSVRPQ